MSNLIQTITSASPELKNVYQGAIVSQLNDEMPIYKGSEKGKSAWSGYQVIRPMKVRRNQGVGATSDGGILPQIGRQVTVQAQIQAKYNYLRFGLTGPLIKSSQNDKGSFVRAYGFELEEGFNDMKGDVNRQLSWSGNGTMAKANAASSASTSVVLKGREDTEPALKFVDVGSYLDIVTSSAVMVQSGVQVTAITSGDPSSATATLTFDQAITCSAGDCFIRSGSNGNEIQGLLTQLDGGTTTVFNVDRSLYPAAQGNVVYVTNTGATGGASLPLSLDFLQQGEDAAEKRGGRSVNCLYSDFASRRYYQKLLTPDKRYQNTVKGDGGFSDINKNYLEWNGKAWIADKDCPTRIFFLPDKYIEKYVLCELEIADETGTQYIAQPETDSLEVRLRFFMNMFNAKASASAVLQSYVSP